MDALKPLRVVIIDDELLLAKTLGAWLEADPGLKMAGYATGGNPGWELCAAVRPDLVLLEVEMSDGDGLTLARRLCEHQLGIRVILMTRRVDPHTAWRAGQTGAQGLVDKSIEPATLAGVIRLVAGEGTYTSPAFRKIQEEQLTEPAAFYKVLTNRELAVLYYLTDGWDDPAIARHLKISVETVVCHRKNLRRKLGLHDDRGLIGYGRKWGIYGGSPPP